MKAVLQSSFNMEVKRLCDDYLNIFALAASNIRENTGDNVPEATLKMLVCKMMEEVSSHYSPLSIITRDVRFPNLVTRCQIHQCGGVVGGSYLRCYLSPTSGFARLPEQQVGVSRWKG